MLLWNHNHASVYYKLNSTNITDLRQLGCSSPGLYGKAKTKTLRITSITVLVFLLCSAPCNTMVVWNMINQTSFTSGNIDQSMQKYLLLFSCLNSLLNPIVFLSFEISHKRKNITKILPYIHERAITLNV